MSTIERMKKTWILRRLAVAKDFRRRYKKQRDRLLVHAKAATDPMSGALQLRVARHKLRQVVEGIEALDRISTTKPTPVEVDRVIP